MELLIVGAGLAGSEAAWQAANRGVKVCIIEMRPAVKTEAHLTDHCAELVCSNSFRSDDSETTAIGLLHEEMRRCDSLIMKTADAHKVPAGTALAVDRVGFSEAITKALHTHPNIRFESRELSALPDVPAIIATGPLTSSSLAQSILDAAGMEYLAFFDAIAPIIHTDSIDMSKAWFQSRYDKIGPGGNGKDYINCPMSRDQYDAFIDALLAGEKTEFKEWEKNTPYFNGCLPIEVMAKRGRETLRFGPMKPVGLTNPHAPDDKPYGVVQLRQDNKLGTLYNIVGFQTKLKWAEQTRIFRTIPGLENAEFAKLGGIHRNTFINSPKLLDDTLRFKPVPNLRFAGQITGVEGYVESAACGLMAGMFFTRELQSTSINLPAPTTAMGALLYHITGGANASSFQPMNVNFGLFPPLGKCRKADRPRAYTQRALNDISAFATPASTATASTQAA